MGIILDIIILVIMTMSIFLGYKKGLIRVAVKLFAFLIALVVAFVFYKPVSNLIIENTQIDQKIKSIIIENGTQELEEKNENDQSNFIDSMQEYVSNAVTQTQNEIVENAAEQISTRVINVAVLIGLFIITRLLLVVLVLISDLITSLPIIKQFNELGGVIYGTIRGLLLIYVVLAIAFFVVSITANNVVVETINNSFITEFMYENNLLLNIIFRK